MFTSGFIPEGTPEQVLAVFADSPPHQAVMLSKNGWEFLDLHPAMGAAIARVTMHSPAAASAAVKPDNLGRRDLLLLVTMRHLPN